MITAARAAGMTHLLLGAGMLVANFDFDALHDLDDLDTAIARAVWDGHDILGLTTGGGQLLINRRLHRPQIEGQPFSVRGLVFCSSLEASLSGALLELSRDNLSRFVSFAGDGIAFGLPALRSVAWVGELADKRRVVIEIMNGATTDLMISFADKKEAYIPFELYAASDQRDGADVAPVRIVFYNSIGDTVTLGGSPVSVTGLADGQVKRLWQIYTPRQDGEGVPGPDNLRPLVGHPYAWGTVSIDGEPLNAVRGILVDDCLNVPAPRLFGYRIDRINGILYKTHEYLPRYDGRWLPGAWLSDRDLQGPETPQPTPGAEVCWALEKPLRYRILGGPAPRAITAGEQLTVSCDDEALELAVVIPTEA